MWELLNKRMKGKQNTNGLKENPQNIVPWRPRKGISLVNHELKEAGYSPASKQDIEATYMSLLQLEDEEIKKLEQDKTKPILVNILARNMRGERGFDIIEKMLDRGIGKAVQPFEDAKPSNTWLKALQNLLK
jgi:hypothetical protein